MDTSSSKVFYNLLLSQPRTCSHLLTRILNLPAQPAVHKHPGDGYFFMDIIGARFAKKLSGTGIATFSEDKVPAYHTILQKCVKDMEDWVKEVAETGKGCFVKQHVCWMIDPVSEINFIRDLKIDGQEAWDFGGKVDRTEVKSERSEGNDTVLPDALLKEFCPTFLIRHPALAFPSMVRASRDALDSPDGQNWELNYHWSKRMYEWYASRLSVQEKRSATNGIEFPIVLDSDDIEHPPLVEKYAQAIGLDKSLLRWKWPVVTPQEVEQNGMIMARMKDTLMNSQGIVKGKSSEGLDVEVEKEKWMKEFGEDLGGKLCLLVDKAMEDYEWLRERRLRA
ncbi:hypothetical protein K458DRAFT_412079 [Lentithecium fluviatile CBS 122367]|uniref:P-loop containing nucleoside triphosphate hydrolase protein n=1 Tax=Lentithecium fluviatile CBS 122367 TaxID=1168545 RepID=A0A6G1JKS4_9PLEO|nr:hypothetical protein K458DRAFT_412079 [Lentithecium fluviatile CBS 122367]